MTDMAEHRRATHRAPAGGTLAVVAAMAGLLATLAVAGGDDDYVAKVGPTIITRAEFEAQARRQEGPAAASDSARQALLDALIQKELLVLEAKDRGYFDAHVDSAATAFGESLLRTRVQEEEVRIDSTVTDQEVQDAFARARDEIRMRHILNPSSAAMDSARRRIDAGEPFATVAAQVSIDAQTAREGGLLPWMTDRQLITEFRRALEPITIGKVAGPFESAYGWHIAAVDSVRPRAGADLEKERESITADILAERQLDHKNAVLATYRQEHHFKLDDPAVAATLVEADAAFRKAKEDTALFRAPTAEKWHPTTPGRVLATYDDHQILVSDYKDYIVSGGFQYLPRRLNPVGIRSDVRELFYDEARLAAAKKQGFDQDPEWKRRVALRREELAVERLYADIMAGAEFPEPELRAYYDKNTELFQRPATVRYSYIQVDDASVAQAMIPEMEKISHVAFDTTLAEDQRRQAAVLFDSLEAEVKRSGHFVNAMRDSGNREAWGTALVADAIVGMKPGDVGHVIEYDGLHVVFIYIDSAPQTTIPYDEARERVERTLRNIESDKRLKATLADLEKKYGVERHPERLGLGQG